MRYVLNGGKVSGAPNPESYVEGASPVKLNNPTRNGYDFLGWTDNIGTKTPKKDYYLSSDVAQDITITANWEIIVYNILYNVSDLNLLNRHNEELCLAAIPTNPVTYTIEDTVHLIPVEGDIDYTFLGWIYKGGDPSKATKDFSILKGSTGDKSIVAVWDFTPHVSTISYELNGGVLKEENPSQYQVTDEPFTLLAPTKESYTFVGWREVGSEDEPNPTYTVNTRGYRDLSLEAVWVPVSFKIDYVLNGGFYLYDLSNPTEYNKETESFTLVAPYKYNYNFLGWIVAGDESLTLHDTFTVSKGTVGDLKFYAIFEWVENPVGAITAMQLQTEVFGKNNIPRPNWVVKVPADGDYHYEKGYGKAGDFNTSLKLATNEALYSLGSWAGTYVYTDYTEEGNEAEVSMNLNSSSHVYGRDVVEYWEDSEGGVWVLVGVPVNGDKDAVDFLLGKESTPEVEYVYKEPTFMEVLNLILDKTDSVSF